MGLLTDPSAGQGKITKTLLKYSNKLSVLLYIIGVIWFGLLAYPPMNLSTYFSENALLPGLVTPEFTDKLSARQYHNELLEEMEKYPDGIPYSWILAKFHQIGLDVYVHNFTLKYPLGLAQRFTGKNVYGILRAPRASSTEAVVLSVPYRPFTSVHPTTAPSIAVMLAFAKFANRENYWAKDIIFLITEHEQLGMQAWLQAYHGVTCGDENVLDHGDLKGRAGAIQAAINLELHNLSISQIDIKIEGLNGQLPNLDLFNLAAKMCYKEHIYYTFKNKPARTWKTPLKQWYYSFKTLMTMVLTQATGIPNGNHGLYHRFGIEALTIEGFSLNGRKGGTKVSMPGLGRLVERIFRSLNNLLERFHQSYFFYLLPSSDRFISIGLYMPSICLIAGTLLIKACAMWFQLQHRFIDGEESNTDQTEKSAKKSQKRRYKTIDEKYNDEQTINSGTSSIDLTRVLLDFIALHVVGVTIMYSPRFLTSTIGPIIGWSTNQSLCVGFGVILLALLLVPIFVNFKNCERNVTIFNIFALLELGTALIGISMTNFSFALLCAVVYVPLALSIRTIASRFYSKVQRMVWFLVHPFIVLALVVLIYTWITFPDDGLKENLVRFLGAFQQAIVFGVVDSMIYGNWLYSVLMGIFLPNWLCFWCIAFVRIRTTVDVQKKTN